MNYQLTKGNEMKRTKNVNYTELQIGDIVHFYGARFEINSVELKADTSRDANGDIMRANGKWLDGETVEGYFGPKIDWMFQGNKVAVAAIEVQ